MSKISTWSTTADDNNAAVPNGFPESMLPSGVNNSAREILAADRVAWNDKEFFEVGTGTGTTTVTRTGNTTVTIAADVTSTHHVGRRVKIIGSNTGTIFTHISASAYSSPNTTITFASGTISASDSTISLYLGSPYVNPSVSVVDEDNMASNSSVLPPSQQSVKAYVDSTVTAQDLDFAGSSGSGAVDLDSQTFTIAAGEGIDTVGSGQTLTVSGEDASTSNKGIASFSSDNFASSSGNITIKDGGVANAELVNSTVNYGGVSLALGASDATPAFNLTDAANYPTSSLTGTISNSQLATGIDATKIADGSVTSTEFQYINTLSSNAQDQLTAKLVKASNLSDVASASTSRTNLGLGTISTQASSNVSISGGQITGLGSPSNGSDATTKTYVDNLVTGLKSRTIVRAATTGNISLTSDLQNNDTLDGVTLATNDKVLVKNQSDNTQNGIYIVVASGTASRDPEFDTVDELAGQMIIVKEGSTNADSFQLCTTDSGSIGSAAITFTQVTPSSGGTVTQVGIAQSGSEFTIGNTPITSSGNITLNVNRISSTKIGANGNVSDTEFGYLENVSSDIQTQLNAKATAGFALAMAVAL